MNEENKLRKRIKYFIIFFIVGLILSGVTAFPIESELAFIKQKLSSSPGYLKNWINTVYLAVAATNKNFTYLSYGTDWLAFAHLVIAVAFIGPLKDPVRNIWIIQFGMIACIMVFPLAFIAGYIRQIPFYCRLIDCSFGVIGFFPLFFCYKDTLKLEKFQADKRFH